MSKQPCHKIPHLFNVVPAETTLNNVGYRFSKLNNLLKVQKHKKDKQKQTLGPLEALRFGD